MASNTVGSGGQTYDSTDHLQQVHAQIFIRHGSRTPMNTTPNVESATWDKNELFSGAENTCIDYEVKSINGGPAPFWTAEARYRTRILKGGSLPGQLTAKGMRQLYELGLQLRKEYIQERGFLSHTYCPSEVYIRSTNIARTQESARSCIAGMYQESIPKPPDDPVVIYTDDEATEILYPSNRHCKRLGSHTKWLEKHLDVIPGLSKDRKTIQQLLKLDNEEDVNFINIRDDIFARMSHSLAVPEVLKPHVDCIEMRTLELTRATVMGTTNEDNTEILKMSVGPLVELILQNMKEAADGKSGCKFHLYACHDSSIIAILSAFDIFDNQWPPFAADLRFEVYRNTIGQHFVKISYVGKVLTMPCLIPLDSLVSKMITIATDKTCHGGLCQDPLYTSGDESQVNIADGVGV
ncbi:lysophosphatidic acid phosphatase type 6-like [Saccoglossus kowalevskii]|uniref:Lysophosphatidic acid phosphatase type 6-like n=1 Tax=Saccoglossus kowalevskii TaxID=10224 RepID=A0ABM0M655_SACKO|nr:PREDICTED: lysophosphatidic acid phosphatase type 6-like [Saccoglossus kowalevskii]